MTAFWLGLWNAVRRTPGWVWGVLLGGAAFVVGVLKLQRSARKVREAEGAAAEARLAREGAVADATVAVSTERVEEIAKTRLELADKTNERVARAEEMSDEDAIAWIQRDAENRKRRR